MNVPQLLLLLRKCMYICFGHVEVIDTDMKNRVRQLHGLPPIEKCMWYNYMTYLIRRELLISMSLMIGNNNTMKCSPTDLYNFQDEIKLKYTSYTVPDIPFNIHHRAAIQPTAKFAESMGTSLATADIIYQSRFPPKPPKAPTNNFPVLRPDPDEPTTAEYKKQLEIYQSNTAFPLGTPDAIKEAGQLYISYMHLSLADYQVIRERERAIQKDQSDSCTPAAANDMERACRDDPVQKKLDDVEQLYVGVDS